jgi:hypothetical protein
MTGLDCNRQEIAIALKAVLYFVENQFRLL